MTASVFERIAEEVRITLAGNVSGIGTRVFRAREDAISFDEGDTLNISTDSNAQKVMSDAVDDNELLIDVTIYVRGDVWETKADHYAIIICPLVMRRDYMSAGLNIARVRLTDQDWNADPADATPGKRTLKFAYRFLTLADDISAQPH
jgi:hypothetical protein